MTICNRLRPSQDAQVVGTLVSRIAISELIPDLPLRQHQAASRWLLQGPASVDAFARDIQTTGGLEDDLEEVTLYALFRRARQPGAKK